MNRTKLSDRHLPDYTRGEELANMITHICGAVMGLAALALCPARALAHGNLPGFLAAIVYSLSMLAVFTISSVYHGLPRGYGKKVLQVIDHCTIYFLIAGSYTAILLSAMLPGFPVLSRSLLVLEWALAILATVLTAIDLKRFQVFSMLCYIGMGWAILPFARQAQLALSPAGFSLLLWGGIAYTLGSVLYGIGKRRKWMHSLFHVFVLLGAFLQLLSIYCHGL